MQLWPAAGDLNQRRAWNRRQATQSRAPRANFPQRSAARLAGCGARIPSRQRSRWLSRSRRAAWWASRSEAERPHSWSRGW